jgi:hypothetical protein
MMPSCFALVASLRPRVGAMDMVNAAPTTPVDLTLVELRGEGA